jgi:uncharacterized protein YjeT (DUF2065 family)
MRNKPAFFGILIAIGTISAVLGAALLSSSGDSAGNTAKDIVAATGAPVFDAFNAETSEGEDGVRGYSITSQSAPQTGGIDAAGGGGGGTAGAGGWGAGGGGTGGGGGASGYVAGSGQIIDRKIQRTTTLTVTVDNVLDAVSKIQAAATGAGGYVSQQSINETAGPPDEGGKPTKQQVATVQIRVPSDSYDIVMSGLRGIAKEVTAENSQTTEVTAQYTDLQSQLRNLEATERQYLALLERAGTIEEILNVSDRLASVRLQIEQVQGQVNLLENLTSLATITVNVSLPAPAIELTVEEPVKEPNFARQALDDAWEASEDVLEFMAVAAITAGVIMVWVLVPAAFLLAGWRLFGGRRQGPAAP